MNCRHPEVQAEIKKHWEITDNGPIAWFLGFQIKQDRNTKTISINQHAYIDGLLEKFQLTNAKPVSTPMDPSAQYSVDQCPSTPNQTAQMGRVPYIEALGSILWPAVVSRPDIAYAVGILSQFVQNPALVHWDALKQVIIYLGTTKNHWLTFGGTSKMLVEGYCYDTLFTFTLTLNI